jgi:hypothetical protein
MGTADAPQRQPSSWLMTELGLARRWRKLEEAVNFLILDQLGF